MVSLSIQYCGLLIQVEVRCGQNNEFSHSGSLLTTGFDRGPKQGLQLFDPGLMKITTVCEWLAISDALIYAIKAFVYTLKTK